MLRCSASAVLQAQNAMQRLRMSAAGSTRNESGKLGHQPIPEVNLTCTNGGCRVRAALVCLAWPGRGEGTACRGTGAGRWLALTSCSSVWVCRARAKTQSQTRSHGRNPLQQRANRDPHSARHWNASTRAQKNVNCDCQQFRTCRIGRTGHAGLLARKKSRSVGCGFCCGVDVHSDACDPRCPRL